MQVKNFSSLSVFTPNPLRIFTFVFEEKKNMKKSFNFKSNWVNISSKSCEIFSIRYFLGVIGQLSWT